MVPPDADEQDSRLIRLRLARQGQRPASSWPAAHHRALLGTRRPLSKEQLAMIVDGVDRLLSSLGLPRTRRP
jgi:hypothetical protein